MKCKSLLFLFLFCSFFGCLILTSNADAITLTTEVKPTGARWENTVNSGGNTCYWSNGTTSPANPVNCAWDSNLVRNGLGLVAMERDVPIPSVKGNYYQVLVQVKNSNLSYSNALFWSLFSNQNWSFVDIQEVSDSTMYRSFTGYSGSGFTNYQQANDTSSYLYVITYQALKDGNTKFKIGNDGNFSMFWLKDQYSAPTSTWFVTYGEIVEYESATIETLNQQQEQATQDASDNSQTTADSSSSDAEQQSQTLLQAFTGFVNAIKNASPTNCNINGNLAHGVNMGNLNFCANSPPSYITIIGSIIAIAFLVPLSYNTAKRLLSTIRSFQT